MFDESADAEQMPGRWKISRQAIKLAAVGPLVALALLGCQSSEDTEPVAEPTQWKATPWTTDTSAIRACEGLQNRASDLAAAYRIKGELVGDVDADGSPDRVTLRVDERRPRSCRYLLVVEIRGGIALVAPVKPLPWPGTDPQLLLLAEIDGRAGQEPVVALSPANAYRPGAVFTMRDGELVRMELETRCCPDDLFPFYDEFPSGVDCAGEPGTIVATFGNLADRGRDDSHWDIRRSLYRVAGIRFELQGSEAFRVEVGPDAKRRWPELRGDPFRTCPDRVD